MTKSEKNKFILYDGAYVQGASATEEGAVTLATRKLNPTRGYRDVTAVGIYQLVKIVRRKLAPVEIEEVACCKPEPVTKSKAKAVKADA